jgi:ABC-2 type transport system permease protein
MAVHEQRYSGYDGPRTPQRGRFLVITGYALRQLFTLRFFAVALTLSFVYPIGCLAYIYIANNLDVLKSIGIPITGSLDVIGARFFLVFLYVQGLAAAFALTLVVGPLLVTPDMRNGALPLYFARPISRAEYVLGKFTVLAGLLSAVTWVPGLLLFTLQAVFGGRAWLGANLRLAFALFAGAWVLILTYGLLALTASALVKWRPAATAAIFGVWLFGGGFAAVIRASTGMAFGGFFDLSGMVKSIWEGLFDARVEFQGMILPPFPSAIGLCAFFALCVLVLNRRLRAFEVVR